LILIVLAVILLAINFALWHFDDKRNHPIEYSNFVEHYANEYNIDKFLIYAIIKTESGFDSMAESNMGARGLMQIMPDTFEWIQWKWFSDDGLTYDDMYTPEFNIRYGARLISYHLNYYENIDNSIAAYHAGDGDVDRWLKDNTLSKDGKTLDNIPIAETQHYVNKVNKAYEIYTKLYGGQ